MKILLLGFIFCATIRINVGHPNNVDAEEVYKWKKVVYKDLPKSENSYIGPYPYYIPENNDITSIGYHAASGLFIANLPRLRPGIPTSLGAFCVDAHEHGSSPTIWGFPNYEINALHAKDFAAGSIEEYRIEDSSNAEDAGRCSNTTCEIAGKSGSKLNKYPSNPKDERIISVVYFAIDDKCNRVFAFDRGMIRYYRNTSYIIQNPSLVVIDLPTKGCESKYFPISRRAVVPDKIAAMGSIGFMAPTIDYQFKNPCDDLYVYIPNAHNNYLLVYDFKRDQFWTFEHETFVPLRSEGYMVFDKTFHYDLSNEGIGMTSLTLGYPDKSGDRVAYYTNLCGTAQFSVSTKILKNRRKYTTNYNNDEFSIMGYRGCGHQGMRTAIDYTHGVMFYAEAQTRQIRCWNVRKILNPDNIDVVYESEDLLFVSDVTIDARGYLWFHTCHLPINFLTDYPLNLQNINSRSFRVKVSDAIRGTVCENDFSTKK